MVEIFIERVVVEFLEDYDSRRHVFKVRLENGEVVDFFPGRLLDIFQRWLIEGKRKFEMAKDNKQLFTVRPVDDILVI